MKLIRPVLAVIVILAVLFVGALAALPYIVSTDSIRLHLAQNISAWTGYSVEIRQPPRMSFFPVFRASLSDVTVSKMGDTNTPFMAAERIEVEMSPLDALFGRVAFTETRLINAHFALSEPVEDLPQFVNTQQGGTVARMVELSLVFMAMTFVVFAIYGVFAAAAYDELAINGDVIENDVTVANAFSDDEVA